MTEGEKLRRYLLGELTGSEAEIIDLRVIDDEDFGAELLLAESELIEAYLAGELSTADETLFHSNFMISRSRKELLRETSLIENYGKRRNLETVLAPGTKITNPENDRGFFASYFWPLIYGGVLVTAGILIVLFLWPGILVTKMSPLEREYAQLNRKDLSDTAALRDNSTFSLVFVSTRDSGPTAVKRSDDLSERVFFRLALPPGESEGSGFEVDLLRGSAQVFKLANVRIYQNEAGREVRFILPKSILPKGQYQIRLSSSETKTPPTNYAFVVE